MTDPALVVRQFLSLLETGQAEAAVGLLAEDVVWRNTSLPTVRGKRVGRMLEDMERRRIRFSADLHRVAVDGDAVLTERTDYLRYGRWVSSFWVCGTFEVHEGRITLWDDHFSMGNVLAGSVKGLFRMLRP